MAKVGVIINADDLGVSDRVNRCVFDLMARKKITSSTILVNHSCLAEVIKEVRHFPECSFGVHLNITEFKPIMFTEPLKEIMNEDGHFAGLKKIAEIRMNRSLSDAIFQEFCAQIEMLLSLGINISHIDSHEHIHTLSHIFPILKRLQRKYHFRKVRITKNIYMLREHVSNILLLKKRSFNFVLRYYYLTKTTSGFTDFLTFYEIGQLNRLRHDSIEIMSHPGRPGNERETSLLGSDWEERLTFPIQLINYNQL